MLEYSYDEGKKLLSSNLEVCDFASFKLSELREISQLGLGKIFFLSLVQIAQRSLDILTSDLAFMKDQITVSEVNIARMHNHNVKLRAAAKEAATRAAKP